MPNEARRPEAMDEPFAGYDDWLDELETQEQAYEREMASRLAAMLDRLREEGNGGFRIADGGFRIEGPGDRDPDAGTPPAARSGQGLNRVFRRC